MNPADLVPPRHLPPRVGAALANSKPAGNDQSDSFFRRGQNFRRALSRRGVHGVRLGPRRREPCAQQLIELGALAGVDRLQSTGLAGGALPRGPFARQGPPQRVALLFQRRDEGVRRT